MFSLKIFLGSIRTSKNTETVSGVASAFLTIFDAVDTFDTFVFVNGLGFSSWTVDSGAGSGVFLIALKTSFVFFG
ncbi:hypothetical protein D3C80_1700950 [compost metagenome]